ncbi:YciI family protein [Kiloniella sp. b19]|uniref:YciI family protein n=1 Tax=Kiloniella sp. GXU_MW_B19 TaxID=3141326 RepID=UPI0031DDF147
MKFAFYCVDKPGHTHVRAENREAHLEYAKGVNDRMLCGGPLLSDDGEQMVGSLLVIDFDSLEAAQEWAKNDPYAKAGLFESVRISPWKHVLPLQG